MEDWLINIVANWGYLGIFLLIAIENIFPPIPSEVILTFGGFMVAVTPMNLFGAVTAATAGSLVGAAALYLLGRTLGQARLRRLVNRWGKLLRVKQGDLDRALGWFERYQGGTVFFCRMVPLVRSLISVPAGLAHMGWGRFLALTALGSAIWNTVLVSAGAVLGERWDTVVTLLDSYSTVVYWILGALLAAGIAWLLLRGRRGCR